MQKAGARPDVATGNGQKGMRSRQESRTPTAARLTSSPCPLASMGANVSSTRSQRDDGRRSLRGGGQSPRRLGCRGDSGPTWHVQLLLLTVGKSRILIGGEPSRPLARARQSVECKVTDNGSAPATVQRGRGLTIVHELVKGLNGCIYQKFGPTGSRSILTFPDNAEPQRGGELEERDYPGGAKATT